MMSQMLPSTVQELNAQHIFKTSSSIFFKKADFEDIPVEKRLKREVSLPTGVENWNISNLDSYLNILHFDDAILENAVVTDLDVLASPEDRLVPESDPRDRSSSVSSVTSVMEDKQLTFRNNFGMKTINTCRDTGSTCISSDHTYFGKSPPLDKSLDPEETYQNLDIFLQQVPEMTVPETIPPSSFSPLPSASSNDSFELTVLETIDRSFSEHTLQGAAPDFSFPGTSSSKRTLESISEDDVFVLKHPKLEENEAVGGRRYHEIRRKNNIASKNCRKTRKEKQKDMEQKVTELEQEREHLTVQVQVLEELIAAHKQCLLNAIAQKR